MSICWAIETDLTGGCMYVYDFLKSLYNVCMYVLGIYFLVAVELFPHFLKWWFLAKHFGFFWWLFTFRFQICGPDYARFKNKHIVEQCPTENVSEFCNLSFLVKIKNKWISVILEKRVYKVLFLTKNVDKRVKFRQDLLKTLQKVMFSVKKMYSQCTKTQFDSTLNF